MDKDIELIILEKLDRIEKLCLIRSKEVLTAEEVAVYTGMTVRYIHQLVHADKIPHYKPRGKLLYFKKDEINDWLLCKYNPEEIK